jgi:hypothetical protein
MSETKVIEKATHTKTTIIKIALLLTGGDVSCHQSQGAGAQPHTGRQKVRRQASRFVSKGYTKYGGRSEHLQSLFVQLPSLAETLQPSPPLPLLINKGAMVSQDRRNLFVTPVRNRRLLYVLYNIYVRQSKIRASLKISLKGTGSRDRMQFF